jgi:hypothetical protein
VRPLLLTALLLAGCDAALLHDLGEAEANDVLVALAGAGIEGHKVGEGAARFRVEVERRALPAAWSVVREAGFPREAADAAPSRLVVGPSEAAAVERARRARALADLVRATPGVVDARVVLGPQGGAAVARVRPDAPPDLGERLRALLAAAAGGPVALELHPVAPAAPVPIATGSRPALVAAGASVIALAGLCALLLRRVRRLRRSPAA